MNPENKYKRFLLKTGYWSAIFLLFMGFLKYLLKPLLPFIIAFAVSMMLQPLIRKLTQKFKTRKSLISVVLVLLTYLLLICLVVGILIGLASALIRWASGLPEYFTNNIFPWIESNGNRLQDFIGKLNPKYENALQNITPDVVGSLSDFILGFSKNVVTAASSVGTHLPSAFLTAVICIVATVFIAEDYDNVAGHMFSIFPDRIQHAMLFGRSAFVSLMFNYAKSYSLIFLITFAEMTIGLLIIGYDYAVLSAFGVAVFDILPIVGSGMILVPWIIITFIQGLTGRAIGLTILWLIVVTARQVYEPRIVGKRVGMHPLVTLVSMWVGLKLAGGAGLFAFPIGLQVAKEMYNAGLIFSRRENPTDSLDSTQESIGQ